MADFQQAQATDDGATAPIVVLDDVHLKLPSLAGEVHILRGLELEVARGATAAIVGPSGSGKSTMMMVMAGTCPSRARTRWPCSGATASASSSRISISCRP